MRSWRRTPRQRGIHECSAQMLNRARLEPVLTAESCPGVLGHVSEWERVYTDQFAVGHAPRGEVTIIFSRGTRPPAIDFKETGANPVRGIKLKCGKLRYSPTWPGRRLPSCKSPRSFSAIFPVNNEASTIGRILLELVAALPGVQKQTIIVDHCSNEGTAEWLRQYFGQSRGLSPDPPLQAQAGRL